MISLILVIAALVAGLQLSMSGAPLAALPLARVTASDGELVFELPPVDLGPGSADHETMALTGVHRAPVPVTGSIYEFHVEVVDGDGRPLPKTLLHHVNLTDPSRRELFLPISLHVIAASKETPPLSVPRWVFGMPITQGSEYMISAMLANTTNVPVHGVRVRLVFDYIEPSALWPIWEAYPWVMDVQFPLGRQPGGSKAFDLPPGHSEHSWEASPAVPGVLLGLGGHIHDFGAFLELKDVTTGEVLWHDEPVKDSTGFVSSMPVTRFYSWYRLGVHIEPTHRYRVTAAYDNPTGATIPDGGMGAIAGLFVPDGDAEWPAADFSNPTYRQDLADAINHPAGPMNMHAHH